MNTQYGYFHGLTSLDDPFTNDNGPRNGSSSTNVSLGRKEAVEYACAMCDRDDLGKASKNGGPGFKDLKVAKNRKLRTLHKRELAYNVRYALS